MEPYLLLKAKTVALGSMAQTPRWCILLSFIFRSQWSHKLEDTLLAIHTDNRIPPLGLDRRTFGPSLLRNYDHSPSLWLWNLRNTTVQRVAVLITAKRDQRHHCYFGPLNNGASPQFTKYLETANRGDICQGASTFHCPDCWFDSLRGAKSD